MSVSSGGSARSSGTPRPEPAPRSSRLAAGLVLRASSADRASSPSPFAASTQVGFRHPRALGAFARRSDGFERAKHDEHAVRGPSFPPHGARRRDPHRPVFVVPPRDGLHAQVTEGFWLRARHLQVRRVRATHPPLSQDRLPAPSRAADPDGTRISALSTAPSSPLAIGAADDASTSTPSATASPPRALFLVFRRVSTRPRDGHPPRCRRPRVRRMRSRHASARRRVPRGDATPRLATIGARDTRASSTIGPRATSTTSLARREGWCSWCGELCGHVVRDARREHCECLVCGGARRRAPRVPA